MCVLNIHIIKLTYISELDFIFKIYMHEKIHHT